MIFDIADSVVEKFLSIHHWFRKMFCKYWYVSSYWHLQKCHKNGYLCRWEICPKRLGEKEVEE